MLVKGESIIFDEKGAVIGTLTEGNEVNIHKNEYKDKEDLVLKDFSGNIIATISETTEKIEQILNYTAEEKEKIDELMIFVCNIDNLKKKGKQYTNSMDYNKFIIGYNAADTRVKKHFTEIHKELVISVGIIKINNLLKINSIIGLTKHIETILSVDSQFDFEKEFQNQDIRELAYYIKK